MTDQQLMQLVAAGQSELFDELVRRHRTPMLRMAISKLSDPADAEDAVQEAFFAAFRAKHTFDARYSFRSWICTILLNVCRRQLRQSATRPARVSRSLSELALNAEPATNESGLTSLLLRERNGLLGELLDSLPEVEADALRLRFFGELKFEEIAGVMESSLNAAKDRVRRGLERLAEMARRSSSICQEGDRS